MKIHVLTLFPEMFPAVTESSILGRAGEKGILDIDLINIRDYTLDKHKRTDDTPYGGGPGMVMSAQPIFDALRAIRAENKHILYMSPRGRMLDQPMIEQMAREEELVILCGHYEGVDQRVLDAWNMEEISIGDYILTGGELPAMCVVDAVSRLVPGVLGDEVCFTDESHWDGLLEYPQYSRPDDWHGLTVPEVLRSGDHAKVARWQKKQSILRTLHRRPDLFYKLRFPYKTRAERKFIAELEAEDDDFRDRDPKNLDYRK